LEPNSEKIDVPKRAAALCLLALLTLAFIFTLSPSCQCAEIEIREDFQGEGDFQAGSNYYGVQAGALSQDADYVIFGQILSSTYSFCGLKAKGESNSYFAATEDHSLSIREAGAINATAKFTELKDSENTTRTTLFTAQGMGSVREKMLTTSGYYGRPVELSGLWHSGPFKLNSSVRVET
jgi:hypothetical protein